MIRAIKPNDTYPFICECDRELPEEEQTIWEIKILDGKTFARLQDKNANYHVKTDLMKMSPGQKILEALREGLGGVKNFLDEEGKEVEIEFDKRTKLASDSFIDRIPPGIRHELAEEITTNQSLTEDERKNSESEQDSQQDT